MAEGGAAARRVDGGFDVWPLELGGVTVLADRAGVALLEAQRVLIVCDLHLEKGTALSRGRRFLPPYDTRTTLRRLGQAIERLRPRTVVALGDSFHDMGGAERLCAEDREALAALQKRREWIWIAGNHDPELPPGLGGERANEWQIGGLMLRHEPCANHPAPPPRPSPLEGEGGGLWLMHPDTPQDALSPPPLRGRVRVGSSSVEFRAAPHPDPLPKMLEEKGRSFRTAEIAGHLHPCAKVSRGGHSQRRPCFAYGGGRLVLPAFGAYTGGLNVLDAVFAELFADELAVGVIGRSGVYPVPRGHLRPD